MNRFIVPKSFDTHLGHSADAWQLGSQCHSPSTMNLNSWRPGGRSSFACQLPFLSFVIGSASVCQSLNVPARNTLLASGAWKLNSVDFAVCSNIFLVLSRVKDGLKVIR